MSNLRGTLTGVLDGLIGGQENTVNVRLLETKIINFDLLLNDSLYSKNMKVILGEIEAKYNNYSDREMVYFICVRKKVRFIPKRCNNRFLSIGLYRDEKRLGKTFKIPYSSILQLHDFKEAPDEIKITESRIQFRYDTSLISYYVYDLIDILELNIGNSSKIVYVGETDFPLDRPFDKPHSGMMRAIYKYKNLGNDIFIYYNLFQVTLESIGNYPINYIASNSLLNYMDKRVEARFIQNLFIWHLLSPEYSGNYETEIGELKNTIKSMKEKIRLKMINVSFEVDSECDIYCFCSDLISKTRELSFSISGNEGAFA